jgi:hypothetical protein
MGNRRYRAAIKRPERKDLTWAERLMFALLGVFTIAYGYGQIFARKTYLHELARFGHFRAVGHVSRRAFSAGCNFSVGAHSLSLEHRKEESRPLTLAGHPSNGPLEGTS